MSKTLKKKHQKYYTHNSGKIFLGHWAPNITREENSTNSRNKKKTRKNSYTHTNAATKMQNSNIQATKGKQIKQKILQKTKECIS